jgi:hypothetical protein
MTAHNPLDKLFKIISVVLMIVSCAAYFCADTLNFTHVKTGDDFIRDGSMAILTTIVVTYVSVYFVKPVIEEKNKNSIDNFFNSVLIILNLSKSMQQSGITMIHKKAPSDEIHKMIPKAKEKIRILTFVLNDPVNYYKNCFGKVDNNVSIQIMLAEPNSNIQKIRAYSHEKLIEQANAISSEIKDRIEYFKGLSNLGKNLEIKTFTALPPFF